MTDFISLDVETANADLASICSIGLVQFRNAEVVKRLHYLIDPEDTFDAINISIHGITPEIVSGAPRMRDAYPIIAKALQGKVVAHHMPFDRTAMSRAAAKYSTTEIDCIWLDTARVARRTWKEVAYGGYALATLSAWLGIRFDHHNAAEDAFAAGTILTHAIKHSGRSLEEWVEHAFTPLTPHGNHNPRLSGNSAGPLAGETIVFTGALSIPRHEAAALAAAAGCDVAKSVSKGTTLLVVGDQDLRRLNGEEKSSKHRRAEDLIVVGTPIRILGESDFLRLIGEKKH